MKIQSVRSLAGALAILAFSTINSELSTAFAQGTAFTYQGQLQSAGNPVHGTYNLQFTLYTVSSGGAAVAGPVTTNGVVISNGLFTVTMDFGASVWNGETNWLQIGVESNGGGSFTSLTPRQQLTPTPYAIYAEGANALGLSGTIPAGNLTGTYGDVVDFSNPGNTFVGNGAGLLNVNATLLNGLTSSNFWQTTGNFGTTAGPNYVGTSDDQPLYLDSYANRGLELQFTARSLYPLIGNLQAMNIAGGYWGNTVSNTVIGGTIAGGGDQEFIFQLGGGGESYYPNIVGGDFGAVGGGYANTVTGYGGTIPGGYENIVSGQASFAAGSYAQAVNNFSFVWSDGTTYSSTGPNQFLIHASGGVGIDTVVAPQQDLSVRGGMNIDQANDNNGFINNGATTGYGLTFGTGSGEGIASKRTAGGNQYGLDFYTGFSDKMSLDNSGDLTINGGQLFLTAGSTTSIGYGLGYWTGLPGSDIPGDAGPFLFGYNGGALGALSPTTVCLSWDYTGDVWVSNNCSVASLTIRGGADLAEPFPMSAALSEMQPGSVVVIDDQHPGQLKLSDQPYDTRVAGVVSGANGIHPGIQMQQQDLLGGGKNVALTGRVYVRADASYGAIRPGDFLTTSATPGYAMRVTDHEKAQGAILGKAMTSLNQGTGMVLVLVTLQ